MKFKITIIIFCISHAVLAKDYFYQVEKNDQLGIILLSLGHKILWPKDGKVNQFKKSSSLKDPSKISQGDVLKLNGKDIVFRNNVIIKNDYIIFKNKIKTLPEFEQILIKEGLDQRISTNERPKLEVVQKKSLPEVKEVKIKENDLKVVEAEVVIEEEQEEVHTPTSETIHSLNLYPGIGMFVASDKVTNRGWKTDTFTGLQPMVQLKGIYSNNIIGSVAVDLLTKKIITDKFTFPINFDYRLQFLPKWNISDSVKLALSHSVIQHSYVGTDNNVDNAQELKSNFVGVGFVIPTDNFWFELYVEKAYTGEKKSLEKTQSISNGLRVDTELVYSIYEKWRLVPGINYYTVKDKTNDYSLDVVESRLVLAREFDF